MERGWKDPEDVCVMGDAYRRLTEDCSRQWDNVAGLLDEDGKRSLLLLREILDTKQRMELRSAYRYGFYDGYQSSARRR